MPRFTLGERARLIADPTVYYTGALKMIASECYIVAIGPTSEAAEKTIQAHGGQVYEIAVPGVDQWYKPFAHESALRKLETIAVQFMNTSSSVDMDRQLNPREAILGTPLGLTVLMGAAGDVIKGLKTPAPSVSGTMRQRVKPAKSGCVLGESSRPAPFNHGTTDND